MARAFGLYTHLSNHLHRKSGQRIMDIQINAVIYQLTQLLSEEIHICRNPTSADE